MATQLVSLAAGLVQKPSYQKSTIKSALIHYDQQAKNNNFMHRNNSFYDEKISIHEVESVNLKAKRFGKLKRRRVVQKAQELPQLGLWCVKASITYVFRKQKHTCQKFNAIKTGINISNVPKSQLQSFSYHQQQPLSHFVYENSDFDCDEKNRRRLKRSSSSKARVQGTEVPRLGLVHLTASISHILRRARAFYNEFCCDAYDEYDSSRSRSQVMVVDPYFSMPVIYTL